MNWEYGSYFIQLIPQAHSMANFVKNGVLHCKSVISQSIECFVFVSVLVELVVPHAPQMWERVSERRAISCKITPVFLDRTSPGPFEGEIFPVGGVVCFLKNGVLLCCIYYSQLVGCFAVVFVFVGLVLPHAPHFFCVK